MELSYNCKKTNNSLFFEGERLLTKVGRLKRETKNHFFKKLRGKKAMAGNREFFNRKLHSLLGVIPVGVISYCAFSSESFCNTRRGGV